MYEGQLAQWSKTGSCSKAWANSMKNLNDSVDDTKVYKENISELAKNLASLNTVYGNMLNAMGGGRS